MSALSSSRRGSGRPYMVSVVRRRAWVKMPVADFDVILTHVLRVV